MLLVFFTFNVPTRVRTRNFEKISKFIKNVKICNFLIFGLRKTRKNLCFCFAAKNARKTTQKPGSFGQKHIVPSEQRRATNGPTTGPKNFPCLPHGILRRQSTHNKTKTHGGEHGREPGEQFCNEVEQKW